jgi:Protein of unknown function (DUF2794)
LLHRSRRKPFRNKGPSVDLSTTQQKGAVFFSRAELDQILSLYGRQVAAGVWRDYAIDSLSDRVLFSIFRRASEVPLYQVEKRPALAQRQGAFCVRAAGGLVLKRGADLAAVLRVIEPRRVRLAAAE